jgi:hypothetical protein
MPFILSDKGDFNKYSWGEEPAYREEAEAMHHKSQ